MRNRSFPAAAVFPHLTAVATLAFGAVSALAQPLYKVIGADGRVSYTDWPPIAATDSRIGTLPKASAASGDAVLPLELRQAAERYPVTLYVSGDDCAPCGEARNLLRRRGVPFAERRVESAEDVAALERLSGGREAPTLAIGTQVLRGLAPPLWDDYLDAAGYPRESRLPVNYRYPPATPLVARAAPAASAAAADLPLTLPSLPVSAGPIRF